LASKQLLIEYGPLGENEAPQDKSIEAHHEHQQLSNKWIDKYMSTSEGVDHPPPLQAICSISIFDYPAMLLEFNPTTSKDNFTNICAKNLTLLTKINPKAHIHPHSYTITVSSGSFPAWASLTPVSMTTSATSNRRMTWLRAPFL
jgi:hypothetical protein